MFHRKTLLIVITAALFLTACGAQVPTATPTAAVYSPEGTPGVKPKVEIILPDPIPCEKVTDNNCKYNFRIKFKETNGASVFIASLCKSYTDSKGQVWTQGGTDGCFDTNIVLSPGGSGEYDRDLWVMGETVMGGKLNISARVRFLFEKNVNYETALKSVQLAWPSWSTLTPKPTSTSPIPTKKP